VKDYCVDTSSSSALMCGRGLLVIDRPACFAISAYRQNFLLHDLLLEGVPLAVKARMWYIHDGAPVHFSHAVQDVLNNTYHDQWIGGGGPTAGLHARQI
jgi:hypothetical protein